MLKLPQSVEDILNLLHTKTPYAYLVGGCVRDMILNIEPNDYDICSSLPPEEAIEVLKTKYQVLPKGIKFGTVSAIIDGTEYEVTTFRGESTYSDGRHPDNIHFVSSIEQDLARRDFTINAMAYDKIKDRIIDPFHGYDDLQAGVLRTVGNPDKRFQEDGLRIIRALRFAIKYSLTIEPETKEAILRNRAMLRTVSKERITDEFRKILTCGKPIASTFIEFSPVIAEIIPEIIPCIGLDHGNPYHRHNVYEHMLAVTDLCDTNSFVIKMAALLHDIGKPDTKVFNAEKGYYSFHGHPYISYEIALGLLKRDFRCASKECNRILSLIRYHDTEIPPQQTCIKRWLNKLGTEFLADWIVLKTADRDDHLFPHGTDQLKWYPRTDEVKTIMDEVLQEQAAFSVKNLAINGHDLIDMGMKPGPEFSKCLQNCLDAVIDGICANDYDALVAYVSGLFIGEPK